MTEKPQIWRLMNEISFSILYPIGFGSINPWRDVCSFALATWVHPAKSESLARGASRVHEEKETEFQALGLPLSHRWPPHFTVSSAHIPLTQISPLNSKAVQGRSTHSVSTWGAPCLMKIPLLWKSGRLVLGKSLGICLLLERQGSLLLYHVFTHSWNRYLWIIYYVPGTVLDAEIQIQIKHSSCFQSVPILGRKTNF